MFYLLVNKNNVVVYMSTEATIKSDGIHVGNGVVFADKTLQIKTVDLLPEGIVPQRYCYTNEEGFYLNPSYVDNNNSNELIEKINYIINKVDPVIDENRLSLEEMKQLQISRVGKQCDAVIDAGVDVELSTGVEHFSLTIKDQKNIDKLLDKVEKGAEYAPYHSDSNQCRLYSAKDIVRISLAADMFVLYNITYCNALNTWIRRCTNKDEIRQIYFGIELPEDLKRDFDAVMEASLQEAEKIKQMYGL